MKSFLLLSIAVIFAIQLKAQSQRFVLFEEFTNASCSPCAAQNPAFDALLTANATKCTSIKYHTSWPGTDPMYTHNPTDVGTRVSYYGVSGVPHAVMDGSAVTGSSYVGAPSNVTQAKINAEYAIPSPFELYINQQLSAGNDTLFVTVLGKATQSVSGTLAFHCAVIEKHIHYTSAPGTNGEKDFYNVMKKMLPSASGTSLPSSFQAGEYFVLEFYWKLANVYNVNELSVVGFIQDVQTKAVHQAANTSSTPISGIYQNDIELSSIENVYPSYCEPWISPKFKLRNNGSVPVSSVEMRYKVIDGIEHIYTYTGSLGFLDNTEIELPPMSFIIQNTNTLKIYGVSVNGVADEYTKNDTITYVFNKATMATTTVTVLVKTDNAPGESTWDIKDLAGNVVASGGPYSQSGNSYTTNVPLDYGKCYEFTMYDAGGNGVCCNNGIGFYKLSSNGTTIRSGTAFGTSQTSQFYTQSNVGMENPDAISLLVYPNPVQAKAYISFTNNVKENVSIQLFNLQGSMVLSLPAKEYGSGTHELQLDCSSLAPATYNMVMIAGNRVFTKRLSVVR